MLCNSTSTGHACASIRVLGVAVLLAWAFEVAQAPAGETLAAAEAARAAQADDAPADDRSAAASSASVPLPLIAPACDRVCLIQVADQYLAAMVAHDPRRAPFSKSVKFTENTAILPLSDGLWVSSRGLDPGYRIYVPDVKTQQVGFLGIVREESSHALLALRLKVVNGEISEAESIVARNIRNLENFRQPGPELLRDLSPGERVPREQMLRAVHRYFEGIEASSGQEVPFDPDCYRRENGRKANNVDDFPNYPYLSGPPSPINFGKMGCREQFDSGIFAYITSIERRRDPLVDEQTGNVFGFFIFRHRGNVTKIDIPEHGEVPAPFAGEPLDTGIGELFKLRGGRIWRIEAIGTRIPYGLPSGWDGGQRYSAARGLGPRDRGPVPASCDRACLKGLVDQYLDALVAHDASGVPLAPVARITENGQLMEPGDGVWATAEKLGSYRHYIADPQGGAVGFVGTVQEGGEMSALATRLKIEGGWVSEIETLVFRNEGRPPGSGKALDSMVRKPIWDETLAPAERVTRERMIEIANSYFAKIERGNGNHPTPFDPGCNRTENGKQTTRAKDMGPVFALGCEEQIATGMFVIDTELRDRRFVVLDEEKGVVYAHVFFDHAGTVRTWKHLKTGEIRDVSRQWLRPHSYEIHEIFKIRNGRIHEIEAVLVDVPYKMRSSWGE